MQDQFATFRSFVNEQLRWILIILVLSIAVGVGFDFLAKYALDAAFQAFAQVKGVNPIPETPTSWHVFASCLAIFFGALFFTVLEIAHFLLNLHIRILVAVEAEGDERPGLLRRFWFRFDPVDEATVKELRDDLINVKDYFGSITHVNAKSWFAGENYLTLLFCQAHELISRRIAGLTDSGAANQQASTLTESKDQLELFRVIVWKEKWFRQKQSIALLRMLYFFNKEFKIPLKTHIMTQRRFNRLLKDGQVPPDSAKELEIRGQFWLCNRRDGQGSEILNMVYGEKREMGETEEPHRVTKQDTCEKCKRILDYLRRGSLSLETVFDDPAVMYNDDEVIRRIAGALKQLDSPQVPTF
jgi:hypothetical protein